MNLTLTLRSGVALSHCIATNGRRSRRSIMNVKKKFHSDETVIFHSDETVIVGLCSFRGSVLRFTGAGWMNNSFGHNKIYRSRKPDCFISPYTQGGVSLFGKELMWLTSGYPNTGASNSKTMCTRADLILYVGPHVTSLAQSQCISCGLSTR